MHLPERCAGWISRKGGSVLTWGMARIEHQITRQPHGQAAFRDFVYERRRPVVGTMMGNHLRDNATALTIARSVDNRDVNVVIGRLIRYILAAIHAFRTLLPREVHESRKNYLSSFS